MKLGKVLFIGLSLTFIFVVFAFLLAVFLFLYKPQIIANMFFSGNVTHPAKVIELAGSSYNETANNTYALYDVKEIIRKNLVRLKEGITYHPAFVLKVREEGNSTHAYVLCIDLMEWEFIKGAMEGGISFSKPLRVLTYAGVYIVDFDITGMWIPQVPAGAFNDKGVIVYSVDTGIPEYKLFDGKCVGNGFVFNMSGEFSGVCSGGKFVTFDSIYDACPDNCGIVYLAKEVENGNIQGEN